MANQTYANGTQLRPRPSARVLVGVDGSPESIEAARQAAVLVEPGARLTVLSAWTVPSPTATGLGPAVSYEPEAAFFQQAAEEAVAAATHMTAPLVPSLTKVVRGRAWEELNKQAESTGATLIAVGSHGQGRIRGILMGSTATELVHKALCSVLVCRPADADFPRRIVVGVDGSPESSAAYAVARDLAVRFDSQLWPVVAHGGVGVDKDAVARILDRRHEDLPDEPVQALVAASADADLVVVGSRGLHGFKALGSVSERVAHRAQSSTLVVRGGEV